MGYTFRRLLSYVVNPLIWVFDRPNYEWRCSRCNLSFYVNYTHIVWTCDDMGPTPCGGALCKECHYSIPIKERLWYWERENIGSFYWEQLRKAILQGW